MAGAVPAATRGQCSAGWRPDDLANGWAPSAADTCGGAIAVAREAGWRPELLIDTYVDDGPVAPRGWSMPWTGRIKLASSVDSWPDVKGNDRTDRRSLASTEGMRAEQTRGPTNTRR